MWNYDGCLISTNRYLQKNDVMKKLSIQLNDVAKEVASQVIADKALTTDADSHCDFLQLLNYQNHHSEKLARIAVAFVKPIRNFSNSCQNCCELVAA
jgi:chromosome condensin MukBEF ATPase and DNA-binding subunit MukB